LDGNAQKHSRSLKALLESVRRVTTMIPTYCCRRIWLKPCVIAHACVKIAVDDPQAQFNEPDGLRGFTQYLRGLLLDAE